MYPNINKHPICVNDAKMLTVIELLRMYLTFCIAELLKFLGKCSKSRETNCIYKNATLSLRKY